MQEKLCSDTPPGALYKESQCGPGARSSSRAAEAEDTLNAVRSATAALPRQQQCQSESVSSLMKWS